MPKQHNRRIFKGYYKRYDGEYVYVIRVMKEMDTSVDYVVGMYHDYAYESEMFLVTKQSFCEMVEINGEWVDKFVRQTQMQHSNAVDEKIERAGFPIPKRKYSTSRTTDDYLEVDDEQESFDNRVYNQYRTFQNSRTYIDYAKDICNNFNYDLRRYQLCVAQKKLIGFMSSKDFEALKEDLIFLRDCRKTVLKECNEFFKERYIEGVSVRAYAEKHNLNRGSVEYLQKKMFDILADELEQRDKADGKRRLRPLPKKKNK